MDDLTRLLVRAREGDESALRRFIQRSYPAVWRFCRHTVGPAHAADAAQETFLAAWRSLDSFRAESSATTWLFVIARRTAERMSTRDARWHSLASQATARTEASDPALSVEIDEMIAGLVPERRLALVLTQVVGLTYAEAALVCDCEVGTIRSRVARARRDLIERDRGQRDADRRTERRSAQSG